MRTATSKKKLSPRHARIIEALTENHKGILSFDLRRIARAMNIADEVMALRRKGFNITCEIEPYTTEDGVNSKIGRYKLA